MITLTWADSVPTIREVRSRFGLAAGEIDEQFGIVEIDPDAKSYTILVDSSAAKRVSGAFEKQVQGPFANTRIAPFGPD